MECALTHAYTDDDYLSIVLHFSLFPQSKVYVYIIAAGHPMSRAKWPTNEDGPLTGIESETKKICFKELELESMRKVLAHVS